MNQNNPYPREGVPLPELSINRERLGRITLNRRYLLFFRYMILFGFGLFSIFLLAKPVLGLSFIMPGGGLLYYATGEVSMIVFHSLAFIGVIILFLIGLLLWVATGNALAPVFVWILSGVWALSMQHQGPVYTASWAIYGVPIFALAGIGLYNLLQIRERNFQAKRRTRVNKHIKNITTSITPLDKKGLPLIKELTPEELALARYFYDRALQPVDGFEGFNKIDQFREAAFRYQITYISNAISAIVNNATPSMTAYNTKGQDNLMDKMLLHPVWGYWQIENIWGNLKLDPNPIGQDNVMYTGWYAALLGLHISNTGTTRYDAPGSMKLLNKKGEVAYKTSFPELCENIHENMKRSDFTLYACEPKFIYAICSGFGALALKIYDRIYGGNLWADVEADYRKHLEQEFVRMDGRITGIRCYRTGVSVPGITSGMTDGTSSLFLNGYFPDIARRTWEVMRSELLSVNDGKLNMKKSAWDLIDFGNYRFVPAASYGMVGAAAREMGDHEMAAEIVKHIDTVVENKIVNGVMHYKGASVGGHMAMFLSKINRVNSIHDAAIIGLPEVWKKGPILADANYPEVLVAKAVSDGLALHLVLYPGTKNNNVVIGISQLRSRGLYRLEGILENDQIQADEQGKLKLVLELKGRSELYIKPKI